MDDGNKREMLFAAARDAGIIDIDAINVPVFGEVLKDYEAGKIDAQVAATVMRSVKPQLFKGWGDMNEREFEANEETLRQNNRGRVSRPFPQELRGVDVADLSDEAFGALEQRLRKVRR